MIVNLNLNDSTTVKLTAFGIAVLRAHFQSLSMSPELIDWACQNHATSGFQLWEVIHIFGPYLYNGAPGQPFENNNLSLVLSENPAQCP